MPIAALRFYVCASIKASDHNPKRAACAFHLRGSPSKIYITAGRANEPAALTRDAIRRILEATVLIDPQIDIEIVSADLTVETRILHTLDRKASQEHGQKVTEAYQQQAWADFAHLWRTVRPKIRKPLSQEDRNNITLLRRTARDTCNVLQVSSEKTESFRVDEYDLYADLFRLTSAVIL